MAQPTFQTRLCPHCANSIAADALRCHYCKAEVNAMPQWPERDEPLTVVGPRAEKQHLTIRSKAILILGLLLFALGVYLVGGQQEWNDLGPALVRTKQESLEKDEKIKSLEARLAQISQQAQGRSGEIEQLKTKLSAIEKELAANKKELAAARNRLTKATREIDRLAVSREAPAPRPPARKTDPSPPPAPARRTVETGLYETVRPTTVFEEPATSSRILSRISKGTQVTAVRSVGDWIEIRSMHGNPPGFIRADDATLVSRRNN